MIGEYKECKVLTFFGGYGETRPTSDDLNTLGGTCEADRFARTHAHALELVFGDQNT